MLWCFLEIIISLMKFSSTSFRLAIRSGLPLNGMISLQPCQCGKITSLDCRESWWLACHTGQPIKLFIPLPSSMHETTIINSFSFAPAGGSCAVIQAFHLVGLTMEGKWVNTTNWTIFFIKLHGFRFTWYSYWVTSWSVHGRLLLNLL